MNERPDRQQTDAMLKWLHQNRQRLIDLYRDQYVAYNEEGIIAHSKDLQEVLRQVKESGKHYLIYLVPKTRGFIQLLSLRIRAVAFNQWKPDYPIKLKHKDTEIKTTMLVESGAELSLISFKMGQDLGYTLADSEPFLLAETIGGSVRFVARNIEMTIDGYSFIAPVVWLQETNVPEQLLLGREIVFDKFNIEFRQADEQVIFTWRGE